tara:strand:- start:970 stop:1272 length:303 start_codon:yes stop_codon:yes gene_type:complete
MNKRTIVIDGTKISDIESFYGEVEFAFTKGLNWKTGRNLAAFSDLLCGGFGVHEYEEPIKVIWENFTYSKTKLGNELTEIILKIIQGHDHIEFETLEKKL